MTNSIKILFLAANPVDTDRLQLDEEVRNIESVLLRAVYRQFELKQQWAVRIDELPEHLLRHQPHIVHFSGHGNRSGEIILHDPSERRTVPVEALGNLFKILKDNIRCVVLNACYSEAQARAIAQHIDCVVGMDNAIDDATACQFSASFYQALGYGRSVQTAYDLACNQLDLANLPSAQVPQLLAPHVDPSAIVLVQEDDAREQLEQTDTEQLPPTPGDTPYKGLRYYDVQDAPLFFGREKLAAELANRLIHQSFLAVIGASGSGKSSLVRAGLIPLLKSGKSPVEDITLPQGCQNWAVEIITPQAKPLTELAVCLTRNDSYEEQVKLEASMQASVDGLDGYVRRYLQKTNKERLLLVVDQFEELFTHQVTEPPANEANHVDQEAFVNNLLTAAHRKDRTIVVLTARADFYSRCLDYPALRAVLPQQQVNIGPMDPSELRRAIEQPAFANGCNFEPLLVDDILEDMAKERGTLPLLSHALLETWKRREGSTLTRQGYRNAGGIEGSIAKTAEQLYSSLPQSEQTLARNIFIRLITLGEGNADTRRRVNLEELRKLRTDSQEVDKIVAQLADARLITTDRDEQSDLEQADVAHEALIQTWQRLRGWLSEGREGLRIHRRLTDIAGEWEETERRDISLLYTGTQLDLATTWASDHRDEMNEFEQAFLDASLAERDRQSAERVRQQEEKEALIQGELAQTKRARNLAWGTAVASILAALLVIGISIYGFTEFQKRQQQYEADQKIANAQELVKEARALTKELEAEAAIEKLKEAKALNPGLEWDLAEAGVDIRRTVAVSLTLQGEELLRTARESGDNELWETSFISATALFSQTLNLDPPPEAAVYVRIPAGEIQLSDMSSSEPVQINEFWMQRTEVTNEQYKRCVTAGVCEAPANGRWDKIEFANWPVTHVIRTKAATYAKWVGGRLPTAAEWERACRGDDGRIYPWGNHEPSEKLLNYNNNDGEVVSVGSYSEGVSPFGLYDMAGNVWEWTADAGDLSNDYYWVRGGAYWSSAEDVRCAYRNSSTQIGLIFGHYGYRVVVGFESSGLAGL